MKHLSNYPLKVNWIELTVDDKVKESEFFLQKIKEYYRTQDVDYYLSAFLSSSRSIPYHLMQDYEQKFSFNIPMEEKEFEKIFRQKTIGNPTAEKFLTLYDRKITEINNDEIGRYMWIKRNVTVHRSNQKVDGTQLEVAESISEFAIVGCFDLNMTEEARQKEIERLRNTKQEEIKPKEPPPVRVSLLFQISNKFVKVEDACERFISLMKNVVSDIKTQFP